MICTYSCFRFRLIDLNNIYFTEQSYLSLSRIIVLGDVQLESIVMVFDELAGKLRICLLNATNGTAIHVFQIINAIELDLFRASDDIEL
jgi:hypothetical protein